jgi:hypothetical protein
MRRGLCRKRKSSICPNHPLLSACPPSSSQNDRQPLSPSAAYLTAASPNDRESLLYRPEETSRVHEACRNVTFSRLVHYDVRCIESRPGTSPSSDNLVFILLASPERLVPCLGEKRSGLVVLGMRFIGGQKCSPEAIGVIFFESR